MFGLAYLAVFGVYLLASVGAVMWAVGYARKNGKSALGWGLGVAFVMYNIVFWDWIPTVMAHKYYCEKEAGFWVYKTLDQWKVENPGVMEGLHQILKPIQRMPYGYMDILDERFSIEIHRKTPIPLLTTTVDEELLVDRNTGEILAKGIKVSSGNRAVGGELQFWLNQEPCGTHGIGQLSTELQNKRGTK
ncbi:MAG: hypothetical protein PHQ60_11905 [Sideroxydans sp.]|nr:hypothetical protein [Sideroxydans sp.]